MLIRLTGTTFSGVQIAVYFSNESLEMKDSYQVRPLLFAIKALYFGPLFCSVYFSGSTFSVHLESFALLAATPSGHFCHFVSDFSESKVL